MCVTEGIYVHFTCVETYRGQKRVLDALELDLQIVVCHHVRTGN